MTALAITFVVTLLLGMPIVFVLGISMLSYFVFTGQTQFLIVLPQRMFAGMDSFVLLAIPLFVLAGNVMDVGGLTQRLLSFANVLVGRFRGGVSLTSIWGSFLFGGVSGSAAADAAAIGSVLIPEMRRQGYDPNYAAALIAVASIMAPLVPPSIAMIIYGALSGTSIARLFVGGIVPGVLLACALTGYAVWVAYRRGYPRYPGASVRAIALATLTAIPVLLLPVIIIVGIRGGVFTPTEAAAVAAIYAVLASIVFYRAISWTHFRRALVNTALITASIYLLIGMAHIVAFVFAMEQLPQAVVETMFYISEDPIVVLLMVNLVLLLLGMVLDAVGIMILTVPALTAIGQTLGMDPVHLGVMVVFNILVGFATPPVGLCLFIVASISKTPLERIAVQALPMILIAVAVLLVITFVPQLVLFLPNWIIG